MEDGHQRRRRCGARRSARQKSASQRLCALAPASACSGVVAGAATQARPERRGGDAAGAEHVGVGEQHLGGHALLIEHAIAYVGVVGGGEATVTTRLCLPALAELLVVAGYPLGLAELGQRPLMAVELVTEALVQMVAYCSAGGPAWQSAEMTR